MQRYEKRMENKERRHFIISTPLLPLWRGGLKRHPPPLFDAPPVHIVGHDATLHAGHGRKDAGEFLMSLLTGGRREHFLPTHFVVQQANHRADVGRGVVSVLRWCPSVDDVLQCEVLILLAQAVGVHHSFFVIFFSFATKGRK